MSDKLNKLDIEAIKKDGIDELRSISNRIADYKVDLKLLSGKAYSSLNDEQKLLVNQAREFAKALKDGKDLVENYKEYYLKESRELIDLLGMEVLEIQEVQALLTVARVDITEEVKTNKPLPTNLAKAKEKKYAGKLKENQTSEIFSPKFLSTFEGEKSRIEYISTLSATSKASLSTILKSGKLKEYSGELLALLPKPNSKGDIELTPFNNSELIAKLKSFGYKFDNIFKSPEIMAVHQTILDYVKTQERVSSLNDKQKMELLFDFNQDGKISTDLNFNVGEAQMDYLQHNALASGKDIQIFFDNLGLGTKESVFNEMSTNLYGVRERFKRLLGTMIERGIKPSELFVKNGAEKAIDKIYANKEKIAQKVGEEIENNKALDKKLSILGDEAEKQAVKKIIKLEAIGAIAGSTSGLGVSFNIKEFTNGFIDSLQLGLNSNGTPGIGFSKKLFEEKAGGLSAGLSLVNFTIPVLGLSFTPEIKADLKQAFPDTIDSSIQPSIYFIASSVGEMIGINISRVDENTKSGIEKITQTMRKQLEIVKKDLLEGKDFNSSEFSKISQNKENDEKIYNELKEAFDKLAKGKNYEKQALNDMMNAYLAYYKNNLYKNAQGLKFNGVGVGVALIGGFLPIPILTLAGEKISQNYKGMNHRIDEGREVTHTEIKKETVGFEIKDYKGQKVYCINTKNNNPTEAGYNFSSDTGIVQAETVDGKIYFSGDIKSISIDEHITALEVTRTIVINGGKKDKKGFYENVSKELPITTSINGEKTKETTQKQNIDTKELNKEALEKTKAIRETMFNNIGEESKKEEGILDLQKMIFEYANGSNKYALDIIWTVFIRNSFIKPMLALSGGVENINTDEEKILILQTLPACLMKKKALKLKNGEVNIGTTLEKYDKARKRDVFFDKIFASEFPEFSKSGAIKEARKKWYELNGKDKSYKFENITDGSIAFSGTQTKDKNGKDNVIGVMQYSGVYNIANAGNPFVEIPGKSKEVVNSLNSNYLTSLMKVFNQAGAGLKSPEEVKAFINAGGNDKIKIDYKLAFAKMGECVNDTIILRDLKMTIITSSKEVLTIPLNASASDEVYIAENNVLKLGVAFIGEVRKDETTPTSPIDGGGSTGGGGNNPGVGGSTGGGGNNPGVGGGGGGIIP